MNFEAKSITDLLDFNPKRPVKKGTIAPFIDMSALPTSSRDVDEIAQKEFKSGGAKFSNGDTLFARITPCLENGKTAKVSGLSEGENGFGSTEFIVMSAKEPEYDEDFVYYLARLPEFRTFAKSRMEGTSGRQRVTWQSLSEFKLSFPPKAQRKIVGKYLRAFDDRISLNTQTNQTLEQMAQAIFKSWFVDFDPVKAKMNGQQPEGMDAATASLFPEKLVESELGLIPEGWEVKPFKKVIDKYVDNRGKTPPIVEEGIPLVEVKHLPESSAFPNLSTDKRVSEETFNTWFRVHVEPKDVLISTVGTIGRVSFVKNTNFGIAQNVLGLRFGKIVEPEYMFYTIKAHRFQHDMDARLVTTVQSSIKRKDLDTINILIPPSNIQKEFCKLVGSLLDGQYSKNAENINLANLRDTLLPKLLSGEIELGSVATE